MFRMPALRCLLILCPLGVLASGPIARAEEVPWRLDYEAARREAREKNRAIVMDVGTEHCSWCQRLEAVTLRDPAIVRLLQERFVAIKIDAGRYAQLVQSLGISSYPTLVFAAPDGRILGMHEGYVEPQRFMQQLKKALGSVGNERPSPKAIAEGTPAPAAPSVSVPAPLDERGTRARELLTLAREDFGTGQFSLCLQCCSLLTGGYSDLAEGREARQLAAKVREDPARLQQACQALADSFAELHLQLADNLLRQGQTRQAETYLLKVVQACPATSYAKAAQDRLDRLRDNVANEPAAPRPVVRGQSP